MFNTPLSTAFSLFMLLGIVLGLIALPIMKRLTEELHEKNQAMRRAGDKADSAGQF